MCARSILGCKDSRFGDGRGCPSANREYPRRRPSWDRQRRSSRRGRTRRGRPNQPDGNLRERSACMTPRFAGLDHREPQERLLAPDPANSDVTGGSSGRPDGHAGSIPPSAFPRHPARTPISLSRPGHRRRRNCWRSTPSREPRSSRSSSSSGRAFSTRA